MKITPQILREAAINPILQVPGGQVSWTPDGRHIIKWLHSNFSRNWAEGATGPEKAFLLLFAAEALERGDL